MMIAILQHFGYHRIAPAAAQSVSQQALEIHLEETHRLLSLCDAIADLVHAHP